MFDALCAADLDWSRVRVLPTDERWVPQTHERSNARLITERLLVNRASAARLLPLCVPGKTPEEVLPEIEALIAPELPISVLVLGMGTDMHTASLFPGAPGLELALDPDGPILAVVRPESEPELRVSLTAWVLNDALSKHLIIYGSDKKDALDRAMALPPEQAPVNAILGEITVHWAD